MSQISEQIWIGSFTEAQNQGLIHDLKITAMVCCSEGPSYAPGHAVVSSMPWFHISQLENTQEWLDEGATKLDELVKKGHRVFLYSLTGLSRAPSIVITYLTKYQKWSYMLAVLHINQRRPIDLLHRLD